MMDVKQNYADRSHHSVMEDVIYKYIIEENT